ncbi:hypothetical protein Vadar_010393 [Vaccinium darrowii]|uniref:Uncharacterized protein n=1 Tax=Vaccinium darrowii TaxID=229202 RepID=A0ACB7ZAJ7_9ERIC|nr:hypothetical protein Vadar_010393 [Vaccinium darrowii]
MRPYRKTLNGQFVKEGEDVLFCGFDEPLYDEETGKRYPRFEIFFGHQLSNSEDEPNEVLILETSNEDWAKNLEQAKLGFLFDQGFDPMSMDDILEEEIGSTQPGDDGAVENGDANAKSQHKRANQSMVWDHFHIITEKDDPNPRAACNYCTADYACHTTKNGTSAMRSHLTY